MNTTASLFDTVQQTTVNFVHKAIGEACKGAGEDFFHMPRMASLPPAEQLRGAVYELGPDLCNLAYSEVGEKAHFRSRVVLGVVEREGRPALVFNPGHALVDIELDRPTLDLTKLQEQIETRPRRWNFMIQGAFFAAWEMEEMFLKGHRVGVRGE